MIDLVTVTYDTRSVAALAVLQAALQRYADAPYTLTVMDNAKENRGFSKACNLGMLHKHGKIIGFLNPDTQIHGAFLKEVEAAFRAPRVVIAGNRFQMPDGHLALWGLQHWVCGAAMFVRRAWFEQAGGFDEAYSFGYEETDLCRRAESHGLEVKELDLPLAHVSPSDDPPNVREYKEEWLQRGWEIYQRKWLTT